MSAFIPIPPPVGASRPPSLSSPPSTLHGQSFPSRHSLYAPPSPAPTLPVRASQHDVTTIAWPPHPQSFFKVVSRSARKWQNGRRTNLSAAPTSTRITRFDPWDFSEVAAAIAVLNIAFTRGIARAERPPREGVSLTYFMYPNESTGNPASVFKPNDEDGTGTEMAPTTLSTAYVPSDLALWPGPTFELPSLKSRSPGVRQTVTPINRLRSTWEFDSRFPRGLGFYPGEGAYKEVAAYLLDHGRFARVPQTALAMWSNIREKELYDEPCPRHSFSSGGGNSLNSDERFMTEDHCGATEQDGSYVGTKMGSFQVYVKNVGDADDYGPDVFDIDHVHRIAVLDIRTLNHDRHGGNVLVTRSAAPNRRYDLVPIDHGYILPDVVQSVPWPIWMDWPMVREPLSESVKAYIECLDAEREAFILNDELDGKLRTGSLTVLKVATELLKKGVKAGLTLHDIGLLIYRDRGDPHSNTELEKIMIEAKKAASAREHHLAEEVILSGKKGKKQLHRRQQSMNATPLHDSYVEDYIVKYAGRRIQDVVRQAAARKEEESELDGKTSRGLTRSRSIPEFGGLSIGVKTMHMLHRQSSVPGTVSTNSPVSSPRPVLAGNTFHPTHSLESQLHRYSQTPMRTPPIQIPINGGRIERIAIPEPVGSVSFHNGSVGSNMEEDERPKSSGSGKCPPGVSVISVQGGTEMISSCPSGYDAMETESS